MTTDEAKIIVRAREHFDALSWWPKDSDMDIEEYLGAFEDTFAFQAGVLGLLWHEAFKEAEESLTGVVSWLYRVVKWMRGH